jgi:hypothetical protein
MELPNSALLIRTPRLHLNTPISQLIKHGKLIIEIGSHPSQPLQISEGLRTWHDSGIDERLAPFSLHLTLTQEEAWRL